MRLGNLLTLVVALALFSAVLLVPAAVMAQTVINTTYARVYVLNSNPVVGPIYIVPNPADPGNTLAITALVYDVNGNNTLDTIWTILDYSTPSNFGDDILLSMVFNATSGLYENLTYTLPFDAPAGIWNVTVYANDTTSGLGFNYTNLTVQTQLAFNLLNAPVDFGNTTVPVVNRRADNSTAGSGYTGGTIKGFPLIVNNTGNDDANITIRGLNLIGQTNSAYIVGVSNVTWNTTNVNPNTSTPLTTTDTVINANVSQATTENIYFWIDLQEGLIEQEYRGNVTIGAVSA